MTELREKPLEEQLLIEAEPVNIHNNGPVQFHLFHGYHTKGARGGGELGGVVPIGSPRIVKIFSDTYLDPEMIHVDQLARLSREQIGELREALNQADSNGWYVKDKVQGAFAMGRPYCINVQAPRGNVVIPTLHFPVQFYRFDLEKSSPAIRALPRFPGAVYFNRRTM